MGVNDFIGFKFGEKHSSDLGIMRVSDGFRYAEDLSPTLQDKSIPRPGNDGTYFFNSYYTQKPFNLQFAFDSLTEKQLRELKQTFNVKIPQKLIFDETPYKYYMVKISAPPQLKYICFEEGGQRIYKGEGTLSLMAYYPYAKSTFKYLNDYQANLTEDDKAMLEWFESVDLLDSAGNYDKFSINGETILTEVINKGDLEADFVLFFEFDDNDNYGSSEKQEVTIFLTNDAINQIKFSNFTKKGNDEAIRFSSANNLLEGIKWRKDAEENKEDFERTGNLYNDCKIGGHFFKLPLGKSELCISGTTAAERTLIKYDYIYY